MARRQALVGYHLAVGQVAEAKREAEDWVAASPEDAWASRLADSGPEWLELTYSNAVVATAVRVRQVFNPGAITKIEVSWKFGVGRRASCCSGPRDWTRLTGRPMRSNLRPACPWEGARPFSDSFRPHEPAACPGHPKVPGRTDGPANGDRGFRSVGTKWQAVDEGGGLGSSAG